LNRIAVTGANGFVGRHLTRIASTLGWDVVGVVRSEAAAGLVSEAGGRPARLEALDVAPLARALEGSVAVVHLAQIGAERGGATYQAVNVQGTERVLAAAKAASVRRVVLFSGLGVAHYGIREHCTNAYFLSKLAAEQLLFESGLEAAVFRPSYIVGPGDVYVPTLVREMEAGEVERVGDGAYRMQPIAVRDVIACVLAAASASAERHRVFDLVGPEPIACRDLIERVAGVARSLGRGGPYRIREVAIAEAQRQATAGGYRGMLSEELACLLCDEVSDPGPLEALLGRFLTPLDEALSTAVRAA
jgi:nucleoside-diphosphate-sugar epimerase